MIRRILYRLTANLPCRLISRDGESPYLERYFLFQLGPITGYLHRFVDADGDEEVHDHPWRAAALCLVGGYREERAVLDSEQGWRSAYRRIFPGRINTIGLRDFHRISNPEPETWTLFVHARRVKAWGFLRTWFSKEGERITVYHRPPKKCDPLWWRKAPRGSEAGREPYGGAKR